MNILLFYSYPNWMNLCKFYRYGVMFILLNNLVFVFSYVSLILMTSISLWSQNVSFALPLPNDRPDISILYYSRYNLKYRLLTFRIKMSMVVLLGCETLEGEWDQICSMMRQYQFNAYDYVAFKYLTLFDPSVYQSRFYLLSIFLLNVFDIIPFRIK